MRAHCRRLRSLVGAVRKAAGSWTTYVVSNVDDARRARNSERRSADIEHVGRTR